MKKNKKEFIISIIAIVILILFVLGATYAYFQAQTGEGKSVDINITSSTVDSLTFSVGDAISLNATQSNFATGMNSLSDDTYAKATLIANNDTNSASANYYVYLNISTNEFEYTTSVSTAELILSITMDGTEVTALNGYDYVSVTDGNSNVISGFDITTASGLITIADNYLIESTGIEVDDWEITVTFVNLDSDQSGNAGKSFSASLIIQGDELITLANYIISLYTEDGANSLYYFDGEGDYTNSDLEAVDYSYRYSGESYSICSYDGNEVYNFDNWIDVVTKENCNTVYKITDDDYVGYWDSSIGDNFTNPASVSWDSESSTCVIDSLDGETYYLYTWYYHNISTEEQCSGYAYSYQDSEYYYLGIESVGSGEWEGNSVDNYVCFGSDEETCPDDSLYRIIGVFQNDYGTYEIKLIKADYANSDLLGTDGDYSSYTYTASSSSNYTGSHSTINQYYWNYVNSNIASTESGYVNVWSYSQLNTVNLNTNYLNNIGEERSGMITEHTWIVGGNTFSNIYRTTANNAYTYEIESPNNEVDSTYNAKVGLMYVSDYYYSSEPIYWSYPGYSSSGSSYDYRAATDSNWLYNGVIEWTITRVSGASNQAFEIVYDGRVDAYYVDQMYYAVRPCFYLSSDVLIESGSGTYDSPYRISL